MGISSYLEMPGSSEGRYNINAKQLHCCSMNCWQPALISRELSAHVPEPSPGHLSLQRVRMNNSPNQKAIQGSPHESFKKCIALLLTISTQKQAPLCNKGLLSKAE